MLWTALLDYVSGHPIRAVRCLGGPHLIEAHEKVVS
jgi:hypothetical protein